MSDRPTRIDQTAAKGAKSGVGGRYVLVISLALVVVILAIVALVMSHTI